MMITCIVAQVESDVGKRRGIRAEGQDMGEEKGLASPNSITMM